MGYTTDFDGAFRINKHLNDKMKKFLTLFSETRRMGRNVEDAFGIEGEFYVFGGGFRGQGDDSNVINHNSQPSTQPGLWCQWLPNEDGDCIEWDGGEKFYHYTEWLVYLIEKILRPNGYVLNGTIRWRGEDSDDSGDLVVVDNVVYENGVLNHPAENVRTDIVLTLNEEKFLKNNMKLLE
jgi:hypothetical protein